MPHAKAVEPKRIGEVVFFEEDAHYSRDVETYTSGETLVMGAVVAKNTASGKLVELIPAGAGGDEVAIGIMIDGEIDTGAALAADAVGIVLVRHSTVNKNQIVYPSGITGGEQIIADAELVALGILLRDSQ